MFCTNDFNGNNLEFCLVSDVVEKITTRRREGVGVVVEKNEESRRTFNKNSCGLLTAITHTEILCALYTKQINNLTRKQNYESKTVDVSMM